jgi:glucokinase
MSQARRAVGVDVGGTTIKFAVVTSDGDVLQRSTLDTDADRGPDAVLARIVEGITPLLSSHGSELAGIGIGVPGVINARGEVSYPPNFPGWEVVPVADRLRDMLGAGIPLAVENDANIAAFAEAKIGAGKDVEDFLYVTLGTGVGGCIVTGGGIWRGGGEFGHLSVDAFGPHCKCGSRGCIEAYIGQRYMTAIARGRLEGHPGSLLHTMMREGRALEPRLIDEAARAGDVFSRTFLAEMGELLGTALASALNLCDLHFVVVGGGLSRAEETLLEPARHSLGARVLRTIAHDVELRVARFSADAGIVGAALYGMR